MRVSLRQLTRNLFLFTIVAILFSSCAASRRAKQAKINTVIKTARTYTGVPYKWGGTSRSGMDCSGLVCTSYNSVNVSLPRTVVAQKKTGKGVSQNKLKKGDIVIFKIKRKGKDSWHSGIVTDVIGKDKVMFIHASVSRGVMESNLKDNYWIKSYKKARRIIK